MSEVWCDDKNMIRLLAWWRQRDIGCYLPQKICCSVSARGEVISKNNAIAQCLIAGIFVNKNGMLKNAFWLHNESKKPSAKAAAHTRQSARHCCTTQYLDAELCEVIRRCDGW